MDKILTVEEVAAILNLSPEVIRRKLRSGEINGFKTSPTGGEWRIYQSAVEAYTQRKGE